MESPESPSSCFLCPLHGTNSVFRQVFELTSDAFFLLKKLPSGSWSYDEVNRSSEGFLHATADQLRGRPLDEVLPRDLAAYFADRCAQCVERGGPYTYDEEVDLPVGHSYFSTSLIPLRDDHGEISRIAGVCRDVTEHRRAEDTRRESQKLESLGVMAGGIAHDFNNLLTIAMGNVSLLQAHIPADRPEYHSLLSLEEALLKSADLTRQILAYAGRGRMAITTLDLTTTVQGMAGLITASVPKKIRVEYDLRDHLAQVDADASQIQQVVMNLVMNAAEAIGSEVGSVTLSSSQETLEESQLLALLPGQSVRPGPLVILEIRDTGPGIDPQNLPRIFDPFFTTKVVGRGLGLSAVQGILRSQGAGIRIQSNPGQGTLFRLYFPASAMSGSLEAHQPPEAVAPRKASILFVDDEPEILSVGSTLLEEMGFEVTLARDGFEAVERFRQDPEAFDLVILDVSMPRMDGREAFGLMRQTRTIPVLFCSGYSQEEIPAQILNQGDVAFLNKPYRIRDFQNSIAQLLPRVPQP